MIKSIKTSPAIANILKNCVFVSAENSVLTLNLDDKFNQLLTNSIKLKIDELLKPYYPNIVINFLQIKGETLAQKEENIKHKTLSTAQKTFLTDKSLIKLQEVFEVKFETKNIKILSQEKSK